MGTPEFAVPTLKALCGTNHEVAAVFTQPDKPRNRGKISPSPVKQYAEAKSIPIYQPQSLRKDETAVSTLRDLAPDLIVVAAYGQILSPEVLAIPTHFCVNVHASLLPKYRGASPINAAIVAGEAETGVTLMRMDAGLDTGDMISRAVVPIGADDTAATLTVRLAETGAGLVLMALPLLEAAVLQFVKQDDGGATYAGLIKKDACRIDFARSAREVCCFVRGLSDKPAAFTFLDGKRLKVYFAKEAETPGGVVSAAFVSDEGIGVVCGDGRSVVLTDVSVEGGKRLNGRDFLNGYKGELLVG
ncbi:methionyl-tRNA formyltransferase [Clostridia bacterium]|nr:methionyl-tRNA formyltransferase [Clostridia bacterium]